MHSNSNKKTDGASMTSINSKITWAEDTGVPAEFSPSEAELMGSFTEDAISEADAKESNKVRE